MAIARSDSLVGDDYAIGRSRRRPYPAIIPPEPEAFEDLAELRKHRAVWARLKAWHDWDEAKRQSPLGHSLSNINFRPRPARPCKQELLQLALYYFPPRATLKAIICDFGNGRFERSEQVLGRIDRCKYTKAIPNMSSS